VSDARGLFERLLRRLKAGLQTATVRSAGFSLCLTRVDWRDALNPPKGGTTNRGGS